MSNINTENQNNKILSDTEIESRMAALVQNNNVNEIYNSHEDDITEEDMRQIEEGYKALNRRLSSSEKNRWGYSKKGYLNKKMVSKHLNSIKHGLFSCFPIPCKGISCPYGDTCIALQTNTNPPIGEPCILEVTKIENLIVSYANDFKINSASTTDRVLMQELIQLDIMMDRCQKLMSKDLSPIQEITVGVGESGDAFTQPVVSKYYDAWERMSKQRQNILNEMMATRKSRKGIKEDPENEEDVIFNIINSKEDFLKVEERPSYLKE